MAIIGGGIGGTAAALALQRVGLDVTVYEQTARLEEVGAGVIISPNSMRILERAELGPKLNGHAVEIEHLHIRRWQDGRTISRQELGRSCRTLFGAPYCGVHRAHLLEALASSLVDGSLHLGYRFSGLTQDDTEVELTFESGERARADVVLGADGIRSAAAASIGVPTTPRASGYACYRALIPAERLGDLELPNDHSVWLGPDHHFVHYFVSDRTQLNIVAIVPSPNVEESWTQEGDIVDARAKFAGWHPQIRRILAAVDRTGLWGLYDRPARSEWHNGRVAVLGDAAHPMLPFFAQGASQAIEDAPVLAHLLRDADTTEVPDRLARFSAFRVPRVRRIHELASRNATMFHLPDGPQQVERDARIANSSGGDPFRDNAWLYGYDVDQQLAAI